VFKLKQIERFLGLNHITIIRRIRKKDRKNYMHLKVKSLSFEGLYDFIKSLGFSPVKDKNKYLFLIFKHKKHYLQNLNKIKELRQTYNDFKVKLIFLNDYSNLDKDKMQKLLADLITFKYQSITVKDFVRDKTSSLFVNVLRSCLKLAYKEFNLEII